jgi:diguanylate cyclase (GGDEF)-like protein
MRQLSRVRLWCGAAFVAGCVATVLLLPAAHLSYIVEDPFTFLVLAGGVVLGEMLPIKIPRRGDDEELTLSASFAMAMLLVGGLGPALIAQSVASILQDLHSGKPAWRVRFNVGQYTLSMIAAWAAMRAMEVSSRLNVLHPFASHQLPAMLAAAAYTVAIVPLCLAPVVAMYNSVHQSARNEHAARHDSLTGLPNRTSFHETITDAIQDEQVPASVLLMDLDRFTEVNDTLGHRYGDLLLVQVAQRFKEVIGEQGQIARLGGDEFAVISPGADRREATGVAHRIADALRAPFELDEMVVDVQASVGIALFPDHGHGVETLLQKGRWRRRARPSASPACTSAPGLRTPRRSPTRIYSGSETSSHGRGRFPTC